MAVKHCQSMQHKPLHIKYTMPCHAHDTVNFRTAHSTHCSAAPLHILPSTFRILPTARAILRVL